MTMWSGEIVKELVFLSVGNDDAIVAKIGGFGCGGLYNNKSDPLVR